MLYNITIRGLSPLIMHSAVGLDTKLPANIEKSEIARKKGTNRTEADDSRLRVLECQTSLWLNASGAVEVPPSALRSCIEKGARKLKQGPQVREGLIVTQCISFDYDLKMYGSTVDEIGDRAQFTVPVVVQRNRIMRTRAKFEEWSCTFAVETDPELVDQSQIETWLDIAGRRVGIGDWRPERSGHYGRFEVEKIVVEG